MKPLRIAILWHQHQPYYKMEGEFILPWVRAHGVKDYFDIAETLHEFPQIKQTFNLVPSMMLQIEEYINGTCEDIIQRLTKIPAHFLTPIDKRTILDRFFVCNNDNMIQPFERFRELRDKASNYDWAIDNFSDNDWRDLQTWYNLVWIGPYSKENPIIQRLFKKMRDFSEEEKMFLLDYHKEVLKKINKQMKVLSDFGQVELAVSPMYHPILPLLCHSSSALEAMPNQKMPDPIFSFAKDADEQISRAVDYFKTQFGFKPSGMWPSEGSISDEAISLIAKNGLKWIASDEDILKHSRNLEKNSDKYFPYRYKSESGEIAILFRDHALSDKIGFEYSNWDAKHAAADFINQLNNIRNEIIREQGQDALDHAVVPIILDGENCWEFYFDNGRPFLRELYRQLSENELIKTITCSEAVKDVHLQQKQELDHIRAGSWINSNFKIWIGHNECVTAWSELAKARKLLDKLPVDDPKYLKAKELIMIAEGSDWFWWYGDEHYAENKDLFDVLFRWYLREYYKTLDIDIPEYLNQPLGKAQPSQRTQDQQAVLNPEITGLRNDDKWKNAGYYNAKAEMSSMHKVGDFIEKIYYGRNSGYLYLRIDISEEMQPEDSILLRINEDDILAIASDQLVMGYENEVLALEFARKEVIELKLKDDYQAEIKLQLIGSHKGNVIPVPAAGLILGKM